MHGSLRRLIHTVAVCAVVGLPCDSAWSANQTLTPVADSYVQSTAANNNYGGATVLYSRLPATAGFAKLNSHLKFDLTSITSLKSAKLRIYARMSSSGSGLTGTAFAVSSTSWSETGITWNNQPVLGSSQSSAVVNTTTEQWYELDVSSHVVAAKLAGNSLVSLALSNTVANDRWIIIRSKEQTSNKPELLCVLNNLPTVALTQPSGGANFIVGTGVNMQATASDSDGTITKVEFLVNDVKQGEDVSSPYSFVWTPILPGSYVLKARAVDDNGATSTSTGVSVTATDDDSDYDGRSNANELADSTNPFDSTSVLPLQLAHFTFDNPPTWVENSGLTPKTPLYAAPAPYLTSPASWSGTAAEFTLGGAGLIYRDVETAANGVWYPSINLRNGALRFWFRPNWDGPWLKAYSGVVAHYSSHGSQTHRHFFKNATATLTPTVNHSLFTYVYLDPNDPPQAVMLEFQEPNGQWEHRAYWGPDLIGQEMGWGINGTASRLQVGALPPLGQWVRLEVLASDLDLADVGITGVSFVLYGGRAKWDRTGKLYDIPCPGTTVEEPWFDDGLPTGAVLSNPSEGETWSFGLPWSRLVELGSYTGDASYGMWQLAFTPDGSTLGFGAHSNGQFNSFLSANVSFTASQWRQIVLNYTPTNSQLFVDGQVIATGQGINLYPPASVRDDGIEIGSNESGAVCDGRIEEFETYNYPLDRLTITREYPNFGAPNQTVDTDYDGRSDIMEQQVDGTDPNNEYSVKPSRLGYWRFEDAVFGGEQGQVQIAGWAVLTAPAISGHSGQIYDPVHGLTYHDVEPSGLANINCRAGTVRFWFKPVWSSGSAPTEARFIEVGGKWAIGVKESGNTLAFWENRQASSVPKIQASISWQGGRWHQIALRYWIGYTELYVDGVSVALGQGIFTVPTPAERADNFRVGYDYAGALQAQGDFDELETFNYLLEPAQIQQDYQRFVAEDTDKNGALDFTEEPLLPAAVPFAKAPVVATGVLEAEQYDRGGDGIGYHSGVDHDAVVYRNTKLLIQPCDDIGGGYSVNELTLEDWLQFTFEVRLAGEYTFEARMSHMGAPQGDGAFHYRFVDENGNILQLTQTRYLEPIAGWQNVASPGIYLNSGIHRVRLHILGGPRKVNYVSVYPTVPVNSEFPPLVADVGSGQFGQLAEGEAELPFATAQQNSGVIQAAVNYVLENGGGTVQLPAGIYYLAQNAATAAAVPYDTQPRNGFQTYAVLVFRQWPVDALGSNIRIRGAQSGETILKAHNRAVTMFAVGNACGCEEITSQTNITFEAITFKGRPHTRYNTGLGALETGQFDPKDQFGNQISYQGVGTMILAGGIGQHPYLPPLPLKRLNILNCKFINPPIVPIIVNEVDGVLIATNQIIYHTTESPDGDMAGAVMLPDGQTSPNDLVWVGVFSGAASLIGARNVVTVDNYFDGNQRDAIGNLHSADGIVWHQAGGNFYVARNEVRNYGLEGVQFNAGPGAVVQNQFITTEKNASTTALNAFATCHKSLTMHPNDQAFTFTGNLVQGGRHAYLGVYFATSTNDPTYNVHFCGNDIAVDPPPQNTPWFEFPGTALLLANCGYANVSGNLMRQGGYGAYIYYEHFGSEFVKNDFGRADRVGILIEPVNRTLERVVLVSNIIGSGQFTPVTPDYTMYYSASGGHLRLLMEDAQKFFLSGNDWRNVNYQPNQLILVPAGAPVNLDW